MQNTAATLRETVVVVWGNGRPGMAGHVRVERSGKGPARRHAMTAPWEKWLRTRPGRVLSRFSPWGHRTCPRHARAMPAPRPRHTSQTMAYSPRHCPVTPFGRKSAARDATCGTRPRHFSAGFHVLAHGALHAGGGLAATTQEQGTCLASVRLSARRKVKKVPALLAAFSSFQQQRGLVWFGPAWSGLVWAGLGRVGWLGCMPVPACIPTALHGTCDGGLSRPVGPRGMDFLPGRPRALHHRHDRARRGEPDLDADPLRREVLLEIRAVRGVPLHREPAPPVHVHVVERVRAEQLPVVRPDVDRVARHLRPALLHRDEDREHGEAGVLHAAAVAFGGHLFGRNGSGRGPNAGRSIEFKEVDADRSQAAPFPSCVGGMAPPMGPVLFEGRPDGCERTDCSQYAQY
eukprot:gene2821-biopygen12621